MSGPADLVIRDARVFGADRSVTSIAIGEGRILDVGDEGALAPWLGPRTEVIDAGDALVTPGLNDAHIHLETGVLARRGIDLSACRSPSEALDTIRAQISSQKDPWVLGFGLSYGALGRLPPTSAQLDAVVGDRPAVMVGFDLHSVWVSSAALRALGLTSTGFLTEAASRAVRDALPRPSWEDLLAAGRGVLSAMNGRGITAVQDASLANLERGTSIALYRALDEQGALTVRARAALPLPVGLSSVETAERYAMLDAFVSSHADGAIEMGILKAFADGVVESGTAALLDPYTESPTAGELLCEPEVLAASIGEAHRRGWQVQVHAIGDRAVRTVLDAYAGIGPLDDRRHRIEHVETIDAVDIPRFASLGVIASMQPVHPVAGDDLNELWRERLGPQRSQRAWLWGSIQRNGGALAFGSDWPVVPFDPLLGLYAATTRERPGVGPPGGWLPDQRLRLEEALRVYTEGSARASHTERRRGRIAVGLDADLVVWDRDLLSVERDELLRAGPRYTLLAGRVVHEG